jgi:hypothetical protein
MIKRSVSVLVALLTQAALAVPAEARPDPVDREMTNATAGDADAAAQPAGEAPGQRKRMRFKMGKHGFFGRYKAVWSSLDLTGEQRDKLFALQQKLKGVFLEAEKA